MSELATEIGGHSVAGERAPELEPPPMFPFDLGDYRVLRLLGRGGMGVVYEAESLSSGRRVALKVLGHSLDSPETRKRFLREGRLAASINHPNSVYVYGTEEIEGTPAITMELVAGGTLADRVKARGPLPLGEAVDAILQVAAGLEAAHAAGILHRDIKPSNCFLDPGGAAKIGDFGLSISTTAREDSALTLAGSVMGTPAFSSPEQLRGEALDVRADIYSLGVTLYYLLTGHPPFRADNMVALLAAVLEKPAPSPRTFRAEIPEPLARVLLRCLAKRADDRFSSYEDVRRALFRFSSTAPSPATLWLRLVAGCLDHLLLLTVSMAVPILLFGEKTAVMDPRFIGSPGWLWSSAISLVLQIAYYALGEGHWGATLGKGLMGLRVGGLDRNAPGFPRALLRAFVYQLPPLLTLLHAWKTAGSTDVLAVSWWAVLADWLYPAVLAATARQRNGFATLLDLLTRTRVFQRSAYEARGSVARHEEPVAITETMPLIGPYRVLATLSEDAAGALLLGYDPTLERRVWLRRSPAGTAPVDAGLRQIARPGRLRWLQGQRLGESAWDAYEAAPGVPLASLLKSPQPWAEVRHWLCDLAEEFAAATGDGSLPAELSLDRIWITAEGRAKLLDFTAPGSSMPSVSLPGGEGAAFLNHLALSALEGRLSSAAEARAREPRVPVPLRARALLRILRKVGDFPALAVELRALVQQRPAISRLRRLGLLAGCVVPWLVLAGFGVEGSKMVAAWQKAEPDLGPLQNALLSLEQMEEGKSGPAGLAPAAARQPMEVYVAGRYGHLVSSAGVWSSPYATRILTPSQQQRAVSLVARHGHPSEQAMNEARAALAPALDEHGELNLPRPASPLDWENPYMYPLIISLGGFFWTAFLSVAAAVVSRGGVLMHALGLAAVLRDGSDASRLRLLGRACLTWSFLPLAAIATGLLTRAMPPVAAIALGSAAVLAVIAWSSLRRSRSLQDSLAGTWLVPR